MPIIESPSANKPRRSKRLDRMMAEDERLDRGSVGDRLFFENNPDRNYRARLATAYEIAWHDEMTPEAPAAPPGELFLWVLVRQIAPGLRKRRFAFAPPPTGPRADIDEETARYLFAAVEEGDA
jgi:hypothetical protein